MQSIDGGLTWYILRNETEYQANKANAHLIKAVGVPFNAFVGTASTLFPQFGWSNGTLSISGLLQNNY